MPNKTDLRFMVAVTFDNNFDTNQSISVGDGSRRLPARILTPRSLSNNNEVLLATSRYLEAALTWFASAQYHRL